LPTVSLAKLIYGHDYRNQRDFPTSYADNGTLDELHTCMWLDPGTTNRWKAMVK